MNVIVRSTRAFILIALLASLPARADRFVSKDGSDSGGNDCLAPANPCATIQAGIDAAASGEVVRIAGGRYGEHVVINRDQFLVLVVQGGWDGSFTTLDITGNPTILSGGKAERAIRITAQGAVSQELTFEGLKIVKSTAKSKDSDGEASGGGLLAESQDIASLTIRLDQMTFEKNSARGDAGAVRLNTLDGSTMAVHITDSRFVKNKAGQEGGAIEADAGGAGMGLFISNTLFEKNRASKESGGGLDAESWVGPFNVELDGVDFVKNKAGKEGGGGLQAEAAGDLDLEVRNSTFVKNRAVGPGGGAQILLPEFGLGGSVSLVNNTIMGNNSSKVGGGVAVISDDENGFSTLEAELINNIIWGNNGKDGADFHLGGTGISGSVGFCNFGDGQGSFTNLGGNLSDNPMLVDVEAGNLHLTPGSPMIDAASCAWAPPVDFESTPRPSGPGCDIGADEFAVP